MKMWRAGDGVCFPVGVPGGCCARLALGERGGRGGLDAILAKSEMVNSKTGVWFCFFRFFFFRLECRLEGG